MKHFYIVSQLKKTIYDDIITLKDKKVNKKRRKI